MSAEVMLSIHDLAIVQVVLAAHAPPDVVVRIFGSRARGEARRGSDLDLAIDAGRPLTPRESGALADAFEESDLPYTVDLVDVRAASEGFVALIEREWTPLPG
jgi:predicted nucleotidyltransferase